MNYCSKCGITLPIGLMWCTQCTDLMVIEEAKKRKYATAVVDKKTIEAQKNSKDSFLSHILKHKPEK